MNFLFFSFVFINNYSIINCKSLRKFDLDRLLSITITSVKKINDSLGTLYIQNFSCRSRT